jgi:hypothetical protein
MEVHDACRAAKLILSLSTGGVVAATLLVGLAQPAAAATGDSPACADCAALVDTLRADLVAEVPTTHQPVFLTAVDTAEPQAASDVVTASVILTA